MQLSGQTPDEATLNSTDHQRYHKHDAARSIMPWPNTNRILRSQAPPLWNETRVHQEAYFNHVSPFYVVLMPLRLAFLVAIFGWLFRYRPLNWAAFTLILLTFLFHTVALGCASTSPAGRR